MHYSIDCYDGQRAIKAAGLEAVITAPPRGQRFWCLLLKHPRVSLQKDCQLAFSWKTHGLGLSNTLPEAYKTPSKNLQSKSKCLIYSFFLFFLLSFFLYVTLSGFWQVYNFLARFSPRKLCGVCVQMENCAHLTAHHF